MEKPTVNNQFELNKIDGENAHLCGQGEAIIPKKFLPKGAKIGDKFWLTLADSKTADLRNQAMVKEILNEILKPDK